MIPDFKTYIGESVWGDIRRRGNGSEIKQEDNINHLEFDDFFVYLKKRYEVCIPDPDDFYSIGQRLDPITNIAEIYITLERNKCEETPNMTNRTVTIQKNWSDSPQKPTLGSVLEPGEIRIRPNKYVFRLYPNELKKTFSNKYEIDWSPSGEGKIMPKDGKVTNQVCVDVLDKLLGIVEEPILRKKK